MPSSKASALLHPYMHTCDGQQLRARDKLLHSGSQRCRAGICIAVASCCYMHCATRLPVCPCQAGLSGADAAVAAAVLTAAVSAATHWLAGEGEGVPNTELRLELQGGAQGSQPAEQCGSR